MPSDATASDDLDLRARLAARSCVVDPFEFERTRFARRHEKAEVGIGGDARCHAHGEDLRAVVAAVEAPDNVARYVLAGLVGAVSRLHRVTDRNPDFERLAAA